MKHSKPKLLCFFSLAFLGFIFLIPAPCPALTMKGLESGIGRNEAILVTSEDGSILASKNENTLLVPASTLKILTSLCAIHYLGEDYRFPLKFHLRDKKDLVIEGFGDPLLVSEVIEKYCIEISSALKSKGVTSIRNIVLDDSYFSHPISIPGATLSSDQPYDAPVGALSANFNSISFKTEKGRLVSSEPQTPLTNTAEKIARKSGLKAGRIPFPPDNGVITSYCGELFEYFMKKAGIKINGSIIQGKKEKTDLLIHTALSPHKLTESISRLLDFSSNFMANQIFLSYAAKSEGAPADLEKGIKASEKYAKSKLGIMDLSISEGSGLSRQNKISAVDMAKILEAFQPFHKLMKKKDGVYFKTGTLDGVSSRAGYISTKDGEMLRFVILLNSNGRNAESVLGLLKSASSNYR